MTISNRILEFSLHCSNSHFPFIFLAIPYIMLIVREVSNGKKDELSDKKSF